MLVFKEQPLSYHRWAQPIASLPRGDVASATKVLKLGKVLGKKKKKKEKPIVMENDTREQMYHVAMAA